MLKSIFTSFARSYGRSMGRTAARRTSWLAIPMLLVVVAIGLAQLASSLDWSDLTVWAHNMLVSLPPSAFLR